MSRLCQGCQRIEKSFEPIQTWPLEMKSKPSNGCRFTEALAKAGDAKGGKLCPDRLGAEITELAGELALPLLPLPRGSKTGTMTLTLSGQQCAPPGMPQQYQEFPGWFLQGSDMKKRDNDLITSSDCLRLCCQSQLPKLPIPTSAPSSTQIRHKPKEAGLAKGSSHLDLNFPA